MKTNSQDNKNFASEQIPKNSINENLTARPKDIVTQDETPENADLSTTPFDYGDMNLQDAKESGYTDKNGHAVSMSKKDKIGSPTGAYTDIGAGRSSVVTKH